MKYIYEKIKPSKPVLSEFAREQHLKETGQHSSDEEILAYREQSTMNYSTPPKWMRTNKLDDVKVKVKLTKKEITTHYHKLLDEVTNDVGELRQSVEDITPSYYGAKCKCGIKLDPYTICDAYSNIQSSAHHHAIKKLLRAGEAHKPLKQDVQEVISSLQRWMEQLNE